MAFAESDAELFTDEAIRDPHPLLSGPHRCAGGHLAQFELEALLGAMVMHVRRIEVGEPKALMSNMLHGLKSFRAAFR